VIKLAGYQTEYLLDQSPMKGMVKSRRVGGSEVVALEACLRATGYDLGTGMLDPAGGVNQYVISASQRQSEGVLKTTRKHLHDMELVLSRAQAAVRMILAEGLPVTPSVVAAVLAVPDVGQVEPMSPGLRKIGIAIREEKNHAQLVADVRADRIVLTNGREIYAFPANPDTLRGEAGDVTLDEFGVMPQGEEIWTAALPITNATWACKEGYRMRVIGTPRGDGSMFYRLAKTEEGEQFSWHFVDIYRAIADGFPINVEKERARIGSHDGFLQEYCCMFLSSGARYIDESILIPCEYDDNNEETMDMIDAQASALYGGMDVAESPTGDYSALEGVFKIGDHYWVRPGAWADRGVSFTTQESIVEQELTDYGMRRICIDKTGVGSGMVQSLVKKWHARVEPVHFTNDIKEEMITTVKGLLQEGRLHIPKSAHDLKRDLLLLRRIMTISGNTRFDVERSKVGKGHGDRAWALALAVHAAEAPTVVGGAVWRKRGRAGAKLAQAQKPVSRTSARPRP
jgi:phage FluMu gp28-like protein